MKTLEERAAACIVKGDDYHTLDANATITNIVAAIRDAIAAEREACLTYLLYWRRHVKNQGEAGVLDEVIADYAARKS